MRIRTILIVALLDVALSGVTFGQQAAATVAPKATSGINFAFDAPHGQLTASGYTTKATPNASGSTVKVSETVEVTLTINLVTKFPKRTVFPCSAMVVGGEVDLTNFVVAGGIETVSGLATVSSSNPSTATCMLTIPFEWTLQEDPTAVVGLVIAYAAAGVTPEGNTVRSTVQVAGFHDIHAGTTMKNEFSATL
jgi:hypothetical protein